MAAPPPVKEGRLVNDLGTRAHGGDGLRLAGVKVRPSPAVGADLDHASPLPAQTGEVSLLVLAAAAGEDVELWIIPDRAHEEPFGGPELKLREVSAIQKAGEVSGTEDESSFEDLHQNCSVFMAHTVAQPCDS